MARFRKERGLNFCDVLLVPQRCIIDSRADIDLSTVLSRNNTSEIKLQNPLLSANMDSITGKNMAIAMAKLGGAGVMHRYRKRDLVTADIFDMKEESIYPIIPSIGCGVDWIVTTADYFSAGADAICIDIAHSHSDKVLQMLRELRNIFPNEHFIVGNIATADAAIDLIEAGATALKVGIGPGSVCTTRKETGAGVPQLTAIMDVRKIAGQRNIPVIADGGFITTGDLCKAIAAGASCVMSGFLFAGTNEALLKFYRGMASVGAQIDWKGEAKHIEGTTVEMSGKGPVENVVSNLLDGIRSSISYCGGTDIASMQHNAEFIVIN